MIPNIIKKICAGCLLCALFGILLFPKQLVLYCIAWQAGVYCRQAFGAELAIQKLTWEEGKIVFKGGKLIKEGELNATFAQATLTPFLDWKKRVLGGSLNFEGVRIVHCRKQLHPIFPPPLPKLPFFTLQLNTTVVGGDLLLYDYLAHSSLFQRFKFDGHLDMVLLTGVPILIKGKVDLGENFHADLCIQEGKIESSTVKGCFMGIEGEITLDWHTNSLIQMNLSGSIKQIAPLLPKRIEQIFKTSFQDDHFTLSASLMRIEGGLECKGIVSILEETYQLHFGVLLEELEDIHSRISSLKQLKRQLYLSKKMCGWFEGEGFPLEKFVAPFLLQDTRMELSGLAHFKGFFDAENVVVFYEGDQFCLESPYFRFDVDHVKQSKELLNVHYFDLKAKSHFGFLPINEGHYFQKNHGFTLQDASALIHFENNKIFIEDISTNSCGLTFHGDVELEINSTEDVDLIIKGKQVQGSLKEAEQFLSHFNSVFLWDMPFKGLVLAEREPLFFHYHFSPFAHLLEGKVEGQIHCSTSLPYRQGHPLQANIRYDCVNQECLCTIADNGENFLHLHATMVDTQEDKKIVFQGTSTDAFEKIRLEFLQKKGINLAQILFECGSWRGKGDFHFLDHEIIVEEFTCFSNENVSLSFSGRLDKKEKMIKGDLSDISDQIVLKGHIDCNLNEAISLLPTTLKNELEPLSLGGHYTADGTFTFDKRHFSLVNFIGHLIGKECQAKGIGWSECSAHVELAISRNLGPLGPSEAIHANTLQNPYLAKNPEALQGRVLQYVLGHLKLTDCSIKDRAGSLFLHELILNQKENTWHIAFDSLNISNVYLSRLKSPWTQWSPRDKSALRSLYIRSFSLEKFQGELGDFSTLAGMGQMEFSSIPKKRFLSNLLFLPTEITARIGLDLTALVPARGIISYSVQKGKVHFQEFKDMYSEGKYSRFYLAEGYPAYFDFQGNLSLKLKMKQYNLLMKLAEFFTITVKGSLLHPTYTFSNQSDDF